jgi:hypothetical protein
MLSDAGKTKDVIIIPTRPWFFKNIVADRTMKIFVDIFLKSTVLVAIFLFGRAASHASSLIETLRHFLVKVFDRFIK